MKILIIALLSITYSFGCEVINGLESISDTNKKLLAQNGVKLVSSLSEDTTRGYRINLTEPEFRYRRGDTSAAVFYGIISTVIKGSYRCSMRPYWTNISNLCEVVEDSFKSRFYINSYELTESKFLETVGKIKAEMEKRVVNAVIRSCKTSIL